MNYVLNNRFSNEIYQPKGKTQLFMRVTLVLEVFMMSLRVFLICFLDSFLLVISKSSTSNSTVLVAFPLLERAAMAIMAERKTDP